MKTRDVVKAERLMRRLRRLAKTIRRWNEMRCGSDAGYIGETEEGSGEWIFWQVGRECQGPGMPIRPWGLRAKDSARKAAKELGVRIYFQTDPRGPSIYIGDVELTSVNYSSVGFAV